MTDHANPGRSRLRRDLRACIGDGIFFTIMLGLGEQFFPRFVLELGLGDAAAGLIVTLPLLLAAAAQLFVPALVRRMGEYRTWVVFCASWQAAMYAPLALLALVSPSLRPVLDGLKLGTAAVRDSGFTSSLAHEIVAHGPTVVVFAIVASSIFGAMAGGPAWTAWVGVIIPARIRARFFGVRTFWIHVGLVGGLVAGGAMLDIGTRLGGPSWGVSMTLAILFALAGIARAFSAWLLSRYSEPPGSTDGLRLVPPGELLRRFRTGDDGRVLLYITATAVATQIAFPFFNPYIINQLQVSSLGYGCLIAAFFVGKMAAPKFAGDLIHAWGTRRVMWIGAIGLVPAPLLWFVSDNFWYLIAAQFFNGAMLSVFELCAFVVQLEHIRSEERTSVLSQFALVQQVAATSGSLIGGSILRGVHDLSVAYGAIFVISAVARVLVLLLLARVRPTRGPVEPPDTAGGFTSVHGEPIVTTPATASDRI